MSTSYTLRFICEFFKNPFNIIFKKKIILTIGHLLSIITIIIGILIISYSLYINKNKNEV